jgi:phosphoglycerate dehydrogenase-like enzyme
MPANPPIVVVEDDPWTRLIGIVLDPATSQERRAAFADFMSPDEPDFAGWCEKLRARVGALYPSEVRLTRSPAELRDHLAAARALVVEAFTVGPQELACAPQLEVVHKYGAVLRNIDVAACAAAGVEVLAVRRRANIACAEHAFALMLMLAGRMHRTRGLSGNTIGIIGLGEIGREIALKAAAFGMNVLYFQRTRLAPNEEEALRVAYRPLPDLLAHSDWVVPQLPGDGATRHFLGREQLAQMKAGAGLVNVARAEVVERDALIAALRSGQLGGFALDPLYEEPGRADDELLAFDEVILTPHLAGSPRWNGLRDIEELITGLARVLDG